MKLDENEIDKLIEQVLSEVALPKIPTSNLEPDEEWNSPKEWPKIKKDSDYTSHKEKLNDLAKALGIDGQLFFKLGLSLLPSGKAQTASAVLRYLSDNGLAQPAASKLDSKDLLLRTAIDKSKAPNSLPSSGGAYKINRIRLEFLFNLANGGNTKVQKYLEAFLTAPDTNNLGIMSMAVNASKGWGAKTIKDIEQGIIAKRGKPQGFKGDGEELEKKFDDEETFAQQATVSEPTMRSQRAERNLPSPSEYAVFNNFRGSNITDTIKRLSNFSKTFFQVSENKQPTVQDIDKVKELLTNTMVMDYLVSFTKEIDSGSGAYFFEGFLAYLAGGQAGGKESGATGGMGEADFIKGDGTKGSAKYLRKGGKVDQSTKSFVTGDPVEYVVGYKTDSRGASVTDPDKILKVAIHVVTVTKESGPDSEQMVTFNVGGKEVKAPITGRLDITKEIGNDNKVGDLILAKMDKKDVVSYRKQIDEFSTTVLKDIEKEVFGYFKDLQKALVDARERSKVYAATGEREQGEEAVKAINSAKENQEKIQNVFDNPAPATTSESKMSDLDKLILEVLKENT